MSENDETLLDQAENDPETPKDSVEKPKEAEEITPDSPYKIELDRLKKKLAHKEKVIQDKEAKLSDVLSEIKGLKDSFDQKNEKDDEEVEIEGSRFSKRDIENLGKGLRAHGIDPNSMKEIKGLISEMNATLQETKLERYLDQAASSSEERELIAHHLKESVNPALPFEEKLAAAKVLANRHLTEKKIDEETEEANEDAALSGARSGGIPSVKFGQAAMSRSGKEALKILKSADPSKKWEKHLS